LRIEKKSAGFEAKSSVTGEQVTLPGPLKKFLYVELSHTSLQIIERVSEGRYSPKLSSLVFMSGWVNWQRRLPYQERLFLNVLRNGAMEIIAVTKRILDEGIASGRKERNMEQLERAMESINGRLREMSTVYDGTTWVTQPGRTEDFLSESSDDSSDDSSDVVEVDRPEPVPEPAEEADPVGAWHTDVSCWEISETDLSCWEITSSDTDNI
jgi:hypothetical protein